MLLDDREPVQLRPGSHIDFEVHVLRKELELGFGLELTDVAQGVVGMLQLNER